MLVEKRCLICCEYHYIDLTEDEAEAYKVYSMGIGNIQDMLPSMNPMEREFLLAGTCPDCQKKVFRTKLTTERIHPSDDMEEE